MPEVELDAQTYEKIMDFALLDPFAYDYYERAASLFKTNFAASLVAFSGWFRDSRLSLCCSIGLPADFMRQAHEIYIHDRIRNIAVEQMSSNSWDGIFWSQDADPYTCEESRSIKFLNENHIHYFAIVVLSREPKVNLMLCKTDREGPFTQRERKIIQKLSRLLSNQVRIRETRRMERNVLEIINSHCLNKKTGLIITDEEHTVLTYNEAALSLMPKKMNPGSVDEIASYVFSLFEKEESNEPEREESEQTLTQNGRVYTMETIRLIDEEGRQASYNLITIRKNRHYDNRVDPDAAVSYGLTERETGIAQLLVSGYTNDEIANQLHISIHTVKIHISNLFRKLRVHTRMEAVLKLSGKA